MYIMKARRRTYSKVSQKGPGCKHVLMMSCTQDGHHDQCVIREHHQAKHVMNVMSPGKSPRPRVALALCQQAFSLGVGVGVL